jgi:hypothetical protein
MEQSEIKITGDMYANSPEEFKEIKRAALKLGYTGKELTSYPSNKVTRQGQFLKMNAPNFERKGKCGYCNSLISVYGIYGHNRKCEVCNKLIYKSYKKGDLITFFFRNDFSVWDDITLRIHSMDEKSHIMRFEPEIPRTAKYGTQKKKKVLEILEKNKDAYVRIQIGKKNVYSFYYPFNGSMNELTKINTSSTRNSDGSGKGGFQKCSAVTIMFGKEYSEFSFRDEYPMPETFHLYRDWKTEKSIKELCRRANISSSPEYYSGRPPGDIDANHLIKLHDLIKIHKGEEAAKYFVQMIEGTVDFSATSLVKRILKLDKNDYTWGPGLDDEQKPDDNIALDGSPLQAMATMMSFFGKSGLGAIVTKTGGEFAGSFNEVLSDINGRIENTKSHFIKNEFLNKLNK